MKKYRYKIKLNNFAFVGTTNCCLYKYGSFKTVVYYT